MNFLTQNAHWFLRIALASVFIFHGLLKFLNLEAFAQMLPISYTEVVLVALAEVGGSLLIFAGGFRNDLWSNVATRVGAILNIPVTIGAITLVHWGRWNFLPSESHPIGGIDAFRKLVVIIRFG